MEHNFQMIYEFTQAYGSGHGVPVLLPGFAIAKPGN